MSDFDNNYKDNSSTEPAYAPQTPETNPKGDIDMPDDNKVTFDSIFNQDDPSKPPIYPSEPAPAADANPPLPYTAPSVYSTQPTAYGPKPDPAVPPVYAQAPVPPGYQAATPPPYTAYPTYGGSYPEDSLTQPISYTPAASSIPKAKNKEKTSFKAKAILTCVAVVLGCATLGIGLSLGGALAKRIMPDQQTSAAANSESTASQANVSTYSQPQVQYSPSQLASGSTDVAGIVKNVSEAVVSINLTVSVQDFFNQTSEQPGAGSGIIFSEDGDKVYIATNDHVVQDADKVTVSLDDKTQIDAHFVGSDSQSDLAVIYVSKADLDNAGVAYKVANFGDSSQLQVGDPVVAIGNAMGEGKTATSGIVSAINKQITIDGKTLDVIQTDAAINPGNSGGALADSQGEVIGINTAKLSSSNVEGMGYSIPSNIAKSILDDLKANGSVKKPYLGIQGMTITTDMMNMYNLPSVGVYVDTVTDGGAAQQAGIQPTDIIVGFNDKKITTIDELQAAIAASNVGDKATIYIYRQGTHPMQFEVTLANLNSDAKF